MLAYIDNTKISDAYNFGPLPDDHLDVATFVQTAINCWGNGVWKDISNSNELHEAGVLKLDITKSGKELEWYPKLDSKKAIEWTLEWFKNDVDKFEITVEQIKKYIS